MKTNTILILLLLFTVTAATVFQLIRHRGAATSPEIVVTLTHDKGWLPTYQENFVKQADMIRSRLGIDMEVIPSDTTDLYVHQMKANLPTEQAPDLFAWWSSFRVRELVDQGLVADLTHLWEIHQSDYPEPLKKAFTIDGRTYGFPYGLDYWPVWYNKEIFSRLGLDVPETWEEFILICDTLKGAGITPLISSVQYEWPAFIWFEEMIIGEDPDLYEALCRGSAKYTDPAVVKALGVWQGMIQKGYFTDPSANMMSNGGYLWRQEEYAMALCGTWYYANVLTAQDVAPENIGAFILPSHNPEAGKNVIFETGPIFIAQNAANIEAAEKVADWWMGREGNEHFARMHKTYPGNQEVDTSYLPPVKEKLISTIRSEEYRILNRYWEATPANICSAAVDGFGEFMLNPAALAGILQGIQEAADAHWSSTR